MDARLLNKAKREVFEVLQQNKLDPLAFHWRDVKSADDKVSRLFFSTNPDLHFTFDVDSKGQWWPRCTPWDGRRDATLGDAEWPSVLGYVGHWASEVRQELETPDPWDALLGMTRVADVSVSPNTANTPFSVREAQHVSKALDSIRELLLQNVKDSSDGIALVETEIRALRDASERMGRKDWFNLAVGTLINIATTLALSPEATKQVFQILKTSLSGIIHFLPPILATAPQISG